MSVEASWSIAAQGLRRRSIAREASPKRASGGAPGDRRRSGRKVRWDIENFRGLSQTTQVTNMICGALDAILSGHSVRNPTRDARMLHRPIRRRSGNDYA
jgi:hypothetical protein